MKLEELLIDLLSQNEIELSEIKAKELADKIVELADEAIVEAYSQKRQIVDSRWVTVLDTVTGEVENIQAGLNERLHSRYKELHTIEDWCNDDFEIDEDEEIDEYEVWTCGYTYDTREKITRDLQDSMISYYDEL